MYFFQKSFKKFQRRLLIWHRITTENMKNTVSYNNHRNFSSRNSIGEFFMGELSQLLFKIRISDAIRFSTEIPTVNV